jgi:hypothetical protein
MQDTRNPSPRGEGRGEGVVRCSHLSLTLILSQRQRGG